MHACKAVMAAPWPVRFVSLFSLFILLRSCGANKPITITITIPLSPFTDRATSSDDKRQSSVSYISTALLIRDRHLDFSYRFCLICPIFRPLRRRPSFPRRPKTFPRPLPKNPQPARRPRDPPPSDPLLPSAHYQKYPPRSEETPLFSDSYGMYSISLSFGSPPKTLPFMIDTSSSDVWFPCGPNPLIDQITNTPSTLNGNTLLQTLEFPEKTVTDFLVQCFNSSAHQPVGVAGFGPGPKSLPSQMDVKKFAFCLPSHWSNDMSGSTHLVLDDGLETKDLSYTPLYKNPHVSSSDNHGYHYVNLQEIVLGDKPIKVPGKFLLPDSEGNGGTIVDSGAAFTFMESSIFQEVAQELDKQMANYSRASSVGILGICFNVSGEKSIFYPELSFQFEGGAKMVLPLKNYFLLDNNLGVACLSFVEGNELASVGLNGGPTIRLGNNQLRTYYMEYDLKNERLGFQKQSCR